jgi:hypothetical protein
MGRCSFWQRYPTSWEKTRRRAPVNVFRRGVICITLKVFDRAAYQALMRIATPAVLRRSDAKRTSSLPIALENSTACRVSHVTDATSQCD